MNDNCILDTISMKEAIAVLNKVYHKILIVLDDNHRVVGSITDGDIRRGLLRGLKIDELVSFVMNVNPVLLHKNDTKAEMIAKMEEKLIFYVPQVDDQDRFINLISLYDLKKYLYSDCAVFILAGGLGTRLKDLTKYTPKPMLPIDGKPMLERLILSFKDQEFKRFYLSVNYLKEKIMDYFGDGRDLGVEISYVVENQRLGTAGPLSLLNKMTQDAPEIIVINADVCVETDFGSLLRYHKNSKNIVTVCAKEHSYQVPYGVIRFEDDSLLTIDEKPLETFFVNAGIYVMEQSILGQLKDNIYCDMPDFINEIKGNGFRVGLYPLHEDWVDVGLPKEYQKVRGRND
jgi:dTDP-glucose pyrophosphorylase